MSENSLPFGKRFGYEPIETPFQVESIDEVLRTELWNAFYIFIITPLRDAEYNTDSYRQLHKVIWIHYFKKALDDFPNDYDFNTIVRKHIEKAIWYKVYEFFEFLFQE